VKAGGIVKRGKIVQIDLEACIPGIQGMRNNLGLALEREQAVLI